MLCDDGRGLVDHRAHVSAVVSGTAVIDLLEPAMDLVRPGDQTASYVHALLHRAASRTGFAIGTAVRDFLS